MSQNLPERALEFAEIAAWLHHEYAMHVAAGEVTLVFADWKFPVLSILC